MTHEYLIYGGMALAGFVVGAGLGLVIAANRIGKLSKQVHELTALLADEDLSK